MEFLTSNLKDYGTNSVLIHGIEDRDKSSLKNLFEKFGAIICINKVDSYNAFILFENFYSADLIFLGK